MDFSNIFKPKIVFLFSPYNGEITAVKLRRDLDKSEPQEYGRRWIETMDGVEFAASISLIHRDMESAMFAQREWNELKEGNRFYI